MKFLKNLHAVASSEQHPSIVWNKQGNGVVVLDKTVFIRDSLPQICKTDEYGTFIRQLNNYGFTKVKSYCTDEFVNEKFQKDVPETMSLLRRRTLSEKGSDVCTLAENQKVLYANMSHLNEINRKLLNEVYYLKEKVSRQESTINDLVKAFINIFNKKDLPAEKLQIEEDRGNKAISHLTEVLDLDRDLDASPSNKKEDTDNAAIDAFLNDEFGGID
ncbi:hypothetical protein NECID01_1612 [Nematocida sp. AWRm77]|nr:hypothetical protein NECID01_1612 [Nematocida sp. AWRm77]